jgi:Ser/Thr protein kinase RdoA (MazF antagonist)
VYSMESGEKASDEVQARLALLQRYLERHYKLQITGFMRLDRGVYRIDKKDGKSWVVRVYPPGRDLEKVKGDEEILRYLEKEDFPSERCATEEAVTAPGGKAIFVTEFIDGTQAEKTAKVLKSSAAWQLFRRRRVR